MIKLLVTGASGFIGKNLLQHLIEKKNIVVLTVGHDAPDQELLDGVFSADAVVHLAGVNRPETVGEFAKGNTGFTERLCTAVRAKARAGGKLSAIIYASSIQAVLDNDYGKSKRNAELALIGLCRETGIPTIIYRLPNVFGKWCRPNYNSVVATFCNNLVHGIPLQVNSSDATLRLVYVDDVVSSILRVLEGTHPEYDSDGFAQVDAEYHTTVGGLAVALSGISEGRESLRTEDVGVGLMRALYATYMSYLPPKRFSYEIPVHADPRGRFSEVLKTRSAGQFSFFTAHPGVTRGGHYHHTKCEKFLVLMGRARFRFRHMLTGETHELVTDGAKPEIVDTVPGWTHDVTNMGQDELIVLLWASEQFDREQPDTYMKPL